MTTNALSRSGPEFPVTDSIGRQHTRAHDKIGLISPRSWASFGLLVVLTLTLVDRAILVHLFGGQYVDTDEAVMYHAAFDFARLRFQWPYFYGQDYGPMLEALLAAPFLHLGVPIQVLMPIVTTLLGLFPFLSFALWHHVNGRPWASLIFCAMPMLMPVEYGMMTMLSRGFVNGMALLAALPWILSIRRRGGRCFLMATVIALAVVINPNTVIFSAAFFTWYVLQERAFLKTLFCCAAGVIPIALLHWTVQRYVAAHPERIVHRLPTNSLHPDLTHLTDGLTDLNGHFQYLMPVLWPHGQLIPILVIVIAMVAAYGKKTSLAVAMVVALVVIMASLSLPKVHDGWDSVFFPLSRMFLAIPLLLAWAVSHWSPRASTVVLGRTLIVTVVGLLIWRVSQTQWITKAQVTHQREWVGVAPFDDLLTDAQSLALASEEHAADLIIPLMLESHVWPQFRAYLHPVLEDRLPTTYLGGYDRRHWLRETLASSTPRIVLITGGPKYAWAQLRSRDPRFQRVALSVRDEVHVMTSNNDPTDMLIAWLENELNVPDPASRP